MTPSQSGWEGYYFQCVELANRFIAEQWGLPSFNVNAENYYDYYINGKRYDGQARTLFGNNVQLSDEQVSRELVLLPLSLETCSSGKQSITPVRDGLRVYKLAEQVTSQS